MSNKVYYSTPEIDRNARYCIELEYVEFSKYDAEIVAEDFHDFHSGKELSWPIIFALHKNEDGPAVVCYSVDRVAIPSFFATEIDEEEAKL